MSKVSLCEVFEERIHDLKIDLESFKSDDSVESHKQKVVHALKSMENWNLFSDIFYEMMILMGILLELTQLGVQSSLNYSRGWFWVSFKSPLGFLFLILSCGCHTPNDGGLYIGAQRIAHRTMIVGWKPGC